MSSTRLRGALVLVALMIVAPSAPAARAARVGGQLQVLTSDDVDYLDPGATYFTFGYEIAGATQRTLYAYRPGDGLAPVPDLADGPPQISPDARTITVHLRSGVRFAPPVNREVVAGDVKYALERGFADVVGNGYAHTYFGDLAGAPKDSLTVPSISGIETPDGHTLVLHLTRPTAYVVAGALTLPITAPVPPEVARPLDKLPYSTYEDHVVDSGPYMVAQHVRGEKLLLVRNPNWDPATDFRPAYADSIMVWEGNTTFAAARRVLHGSGLLSADIGLGRKLIASAPAAQVGRESAYGTRYVALNTRVWPFGDADVRRAVAAATDRAALLAARQDETPGRLATHFLPPGIPGFAQAGGAAGPRPDFLRHPHGDLALARRYMRRAGYRAGRYAGRRTISLVATNNAPGVAAGRVMTRALARLGFRVRARYVFVNEVYTRWCNIPARRIGICASVGWFADFGDPQTILAPTFSGAAINGFANQNWSQLRDRRIDAAMERAALVPPGVARDAAWAAIDRRVTALAAAIPYEWDVATELHSADVDAQMNPIDAGWDLSFSGLR